MNVAELVATLVLDAAGFQSEIRKVDAAMTQTGQKAAEMTDAVNQSVESSTDKTAKSFAKLAKTANGALSAGLSQWDGADGVQKAAKAFAEQAAVLDKASLPEKMSGNMVTGLDRAQARIASHIPKWLGDASDQGAVLSSDEGKGPAAVSEKRVKYTSTAPESLAMAETLPKTKANTEAVLASPHLPTGLSNDLTTDLSTSPPLAASISPEMLAGIEAAVRTALLTATEAVDTRETVDTGARTGAASPQIPYDKPAEVLSEAPSRVPNLSEWPEQSVMPLSAHQGASHSADLTSSASAPENAVPDNVESLPFPHVLADNFPQDVAAQVAQGVTATTEALSAMAPQVAASFARSGAQLAQSMLAGLQSSVNTVRDNFSLPVISSGLQQTEPGSELVDDNTASPSNYEAPLAIFPINTYEPLAVTPPKAEPFAADFGNTISSQTSISQITIHSQATDAEGIADDIGGELERRNLGYQFDGAYSV